MKTVISLRHSPHFFCLSANSIFVSLDYSLLSGGIESFFLLSTCLLCTQQRNFNIVLFERLDQFRNLEREKERERERELESFIDLARILGGREDCLATSPTPLPSPLSRRAIVSQGQTGQWYSSANRATRKLFGQKYLGISSKFERALYVYIRVLIFLI